MITCDDDYVKGKKMRKKILPSLHPAKTYREGEGERSFG
jgi:hypothetical protein